MGRDRHVRHILYSFIDMNYDCFPSSFSFKYLSSSGDNPTILSPDSTRWDTTKSNYTFCNSSLPFNHSEKDIFLSKISVSTKRAYHWFEGNIMEWNDDNIDAPVAPEAALLWFIP